MFGKKLHPLILLIFVSASALAEDYWINFKYNVGIPESNMQNFVYPTSFKGLGIEYKQVFKKYFTIGASVDYQSFYEARTDVTYKKDNFVFVSDQFRYYDIIPTLIKFDYSTLVDLEFSFYFGIGAGPYLIMKRHILGMEEDLDQQFRMGIMPEAGGIFPILKRKLYFNAAYHRHIIFQSADNPEISYSNLSFGIIWYYNR